MNGVQCGFLQVFRIWDIHTLTSLQVFTDNEDRPGEKRIHCMMFDEKHERLMTGELVLHYMISSLLGPGGETLPF